MYIVAILTKNLILDRLDNGSETLTTYVSTLSSGKNTERKEVKRQVKKSSKKGAS